jgi:hypothetical protein
MKIVCLKMCLQMDLWESHHFTDPKRGMMHCLRIHVAARSALDALAASHVDVAIQETVSRSTIRVVQVCSIEITYVFAPVKEVFFFRLVFFLPGSVSRPWSRHGSICDCVL